MDASDSIIRRLALRDRLFTLKAIASFVFGIPLSLVGPLVISTIFWLAIGRVAWEWYFWAAMLLVIPSLYGLEWRSQGNYLSQATAGLTPGPRVMFTFGSVGMLAVALSNPRPLFAGIVDIFLVGPRMVIGAAQQATLRRMARGVDRARAVEILRTLAKTGGVPPDRLLRPGESQEQLARMLTYLVFFECIGVARDGDKVWLLTQARQSLGL